MALFLGANMPEQTDTPTGAIFLSYASQDSGAAKAIYDTLTSAGFEVWFDQSALRGGDAWDQKIRRQIKECALFVPVISAHTQTRAEGYFRLEWHLAEQRTYLMAHDQLFLFPVVVDDTPDAAARVPERFRERQWTRLRNGSVPPDFAAQVGKLLSGALLSSVSVAAPVNPSSRTDAPLLPKEKSVAVLPFANLSGDKENEYFSDGVSEELLTVLQKVPGLRVAARTSAFSFKGKVATAQEIGSKLGVAYLVEGSVQKSGNRVKVTARMSLVASGEEQWSRSYTRQVEDVFALQEELAVAIVSELRGHFVGGEATAVTQVRAAAKGGTTNPKAYEQYLMGMHYVAHFAEESEKKALEHFRRATELDPGYASAWANVAQAHNWFCGYAGTITRDEFEFHLASARSATEKALELEPDHPLGLARKFWIQIAFDYDLKGGCTTADRLLQLAPSDPEVLNIASKMAMARGQRQSGLDLARRAASLDPMSAKARSQLSLTLAAQGFYDEARVEARKAADLTPNSIFAKSGLAYIDLLEGKFADALDTVASARDDWHVLWTRSIAYFELGRKAEADAALAGLIEANADTAAIQIAGTYALRGEADACFVWLERARQQRDPGLTSLNSHFLFDKVRKDPRWAEFWSKLGYDPETSWGS